MLAQHFSRRKRTPGRKKYSRELFKNHDGSKPCATLGCPNVSLQFGRHCSSCNAKRREHGAVLPEDRLDLPEPAFEAASDFLRSLPYGVIDKIHQEHFERAPSAPRGALAGLSPDDLDWASRADKASVVWAYWRSLPTDDLHFLEAHEIALGFKLAYRWLQEAYELGKGIAAGLTADDVERAAFTRAGKHLIAQVPALRPFPFGGTTALTVGRQAFQSITEGLEASGHIQEDHDWFEALASREGLQPLAAEVVSLHQSAKKELSHVR